MYSCCFLWSSPIYSISPNWSLSIKEVSESIGPLFLSSSAINVCFYETILFPRQNLAIYLSFYLRNSVTQMKILLKILICEVKNLNIDALLGNFWINLVMCIYDFNRQAVPACYEVWSRSYNCGLICKSTRELKSHLCK